MTKRKIMDDGECARIFRETRTAKEASDVLGISEGAARSLRWHLSRSLDVTTGKAYDVGTHPAGRRKMRTRIETAALVALVGTVGYLFAGMLYG